MQLVLTEKQIRSLKSQKAVYQLVNEDDPAAAAPDAGTSSDGEQKTGATKWESGATRGPANQIGVTKWSEVVGASLKRGKANPLSEQISEPVEILATNGAKLKAPPGTKILSQITQKEINGGGYIKDSLRYWYPKELGGEGNAYTAEWLPDNWSKIIALNSVTQFQTPDGRIFSSNITHPTLNKVKSWKEFYGLTPNPNGWVFQGYFDSKGTQFTGMGSASAYASGVSKLQNAEKVTDYIYKTDDGEGVLLNLMKGEFAEALLDLRSYIFTVPGMTIQTVIEVIFSETVVVPATIEILHAAILLNDAQLWSEQGDEDPEAVWRLLEDIAMYVLRGAAWGIGKGFKYWIKTPAGEKTMIYALSKIGVMIEWITKSIEKLPGKGLRAYVKELLPNTGKLKELLGKTVGKAVSSIPVKYRSAIVSGLLVYVSATALERLIGVEKGSIDPKNPSEKVMAAIEKAKNSKLSGEDIKTAEDLEMIKPANEYAIKIAEYFKPDYPCIGELIKNKQFEVVMHTKDKDIYKINGEEYINEGLGIVKVSNNEDLVCA